MHNWYISLCIVMGGEEKGESWQTCQNVLLQCCETQARNNIGISEEINKEEIKDGEN